MQTIGIGFLMGFLGSAHCIGMCGAFVLLAGSGNPGMGIRTARMASYFAGKTLTYAALGGILGAMSHSVPTSFKGAQLIIAILTGLFLLLIGWHMTGHGPSWTLVTPRPASIFVSRISAQINRVSLWGRFMLGLLNGLLPCGLVYAALASSFLEGSVRSGALFMSAFGIGTVPALAFFGAGSALLGHAGRARMVRLMGWVVILLGLYTLFRVSPLRPILMGGM